MLVRRSNKSPDRQYCVHVMARRISAQIFNVNYNLEGDQTVLGFNGSSHPPVDPAPAHRSILLAPIRIRLKVNLPQ